MDTLYWITRLDGINFASTIICILAVILVIALSIALTMFCNDASEYEKGTEEFKKNKKKWRKWIMESSLIAIIFLIMSVFVPTTKDMLIVYGVGGTYDWVKDNDKAKELPDKCIEAIDKLMDEYLNE